MALSGKQPLPTHAISTVHEIGVTPHFRLAEALQHAQLHADWLAGGGHLHRRQQRRLVFRTAAALATGQFAAQIGVIDLARCPPGSSRGRVPVAAGRRSEF